MDLLQGRIVRAGVKTDVWYLQTCFLWCQQLLFTDGITGAATSAVSRGTHLVWAECPHALARRPQRKDKEVNRSEILQARIIDAHEKLWERIVEIGHNVPSPYSEALGLFLLLSPAELEAEKRNPELQFSTADEAFMELVDGSQLDFLSRPYIDDTLWEMAAGRIAFALRLLILFSTDTPNPVELTNWPEDELVRQHLQTVFTEQELERFNYSQLGTFKEITGLWEARIVAEIKKALFD